MILYLVVLLIFIIFVLSFFAFISYYFLFDTYEKNKNVDNSFNINNSFNLKNIIWNEQKRGFPIDSSFPPCFTKVNDAKLLFMKLKTINKLDTYKNLLNYISILICSSINCNEQYNNLRLKELITLNIDVNDINSINTLKAKSNIKVIDKDIHRLLVGIIYLVNIETTKIEKDVDIIQNDRDLINSYIFNIYSTTFDKILNSCK